MSGENQIASPGPIGCRFSIKPMIAVGLLAAPAPLMFAATTHEIWEDYLITFRFSQNLAEGRGLVYNPPERVYGFTSPLGMALPAVLHWATGCGDFHLALNIFRVLSAIAFGTAVALVFDTARRSAGNAAAWLAAILLMLEPKSVAFSSNGQEAALMMLGVAMLLRLTLEPVSRWWWAWGVVFGFMEWTRPDGFVFAGAVALANFLLTTERRGVVFRSLLKAAALGFVIYLPWLIAMWWYYGSPIPQTIIAKATWTRMSFASGVMDRAMRFPSRISRPYGPIYAMGPFPRHVWWVAMGMGLVAVSMWLIRIVPRTTRVASLAFALMTLYFCYLLMDFPWYYPPMALAGMAAVAPAVIAIGKRWGVAVIAGGVLGAVAIERAVYTTEFAQQIEAQQRIIEDGTRTKIGLWLKSNVDAGDRVYLEPLGYIGFFSGAHMLDYPGLVAPEITRLLASGQLNFELFTNAIKAEWLVLRYDPQSVPAYIVALQRDYDLVKVFDSSSEVAGLKVYGTEYIKLDQAYAVYRRKR